MMIKKARSMKNVHYICVIILVTLCIYSYLLYIQQSHFDIALQRGGVACLIHFVLMYFAYMKISGKPFTLYSVFLLSFFLFQCGQYIIFGFDFEYNYWAINSLSEQVVFDSLSFSMLCNAAAFGAGVFSFKRKDNFFVSKINKLNTQNVSSVANVFFIVFLVIEIPLSLIKFRQVLSSGYHGVRNLEESLPPLFDMFDMLFVPISILAIVYGVDKRRKLYAYIIVIWSLITALCGDRSSGIGGLVVIVLMYYDGIFKRRRNIAVESKGIDKKKLIIVVLSTFLLGYLIMFAYNFRTQTEEQIPLLAVVGLVLGELGFSFYPLGLTMETCPSVHDYLYGNGIFFSLISGILPISIDPSGTLSSWYELSKESQSWLYESNAFDYGLGYSLNAESYANFGHFGCIWIFVICSLVAKALATVNYSLSTNKFSQYTSIALLFAWFTMPRRSCYYYVNFYVYIVIIIGIALLFFRSNKKIK